MYAVHLSSSREQLLLGDRISLPSLAAGVDDAQRRRNLIPGTSCGKALTGTLLQVRVGTDAVHVCINKLVKGRQSSAEPVWEHTSIGIGDITNSAVGIPHWRDDACVDAGKRVSILHN